MKKFLNLMLVLFASLLIFSCRDNNDTPEDINEPEEIAKVVLKLTDKADAANVQTINYIGGKADKDLVLVKGKTYNAELDFFTKSNATYESLLGEITKEKDQHFVTYEFAGVDVNIIRTAADIVRTDGKKLGIKTEWTVNSAPASAKVNVKLIHAPTSVNDNSPSATNQLGVTTGGETDINTLFNIK